MCEVTLKITTLPFGEVANARLTMRVKMHPLMRNGRKCKFIEIKGTNSGNSSFGCTWTPPMRNCLQPCPLVMVGENDEEHKCNEDSERDEQSQSEEELHNEKGRKRTKDGRLPMKNRRLTKRKGKEQEGSNSIASRERSKIMRWNSMPLFCELEDGGEIKESG